MIYTNGFLIWQKKIKNGTYRNDCHVFIKLGCFIFKFFDVVEEREKKNRVQGKKIKKVEVGVNHNKVICIIEFLAPFFFFFYVMAFKFYFHFHF